MTNQARGTGRTQNAIKMALMAALAGKRVLFITHSQTFARDCARFADGQMEAMARVLGKPGAGVSISCASQSVTVYVAGLHIGAVMFRSTAQQEQHDINTGLREEQRYVILKDHYVVELEEQERQRLEKVAAQEQILMLMEKYGWASVYGHGHPHVDRPRFSTYSAEGWTKEYTNAKA